MDFLQGDTRVTQDFHLLQILKIYHNNPNI